MPPRARVHICLDCAVLLGGGRWGNRWGKPMEGSEQGRKHRPAPTHQMQRSRRPNPPLALSSRGRHHRRSSCRLCPGQGHRGTVQRGRSVACARHPGWASRPWRSSVAPSAVALCPPWNTHTPALLVRRYGKRFDTAAGRHAVRQSTD